MKTQSEQKELEFLEALLKKLMAYRYLYYV